MIGLKSWTWFGMIAFAASSVVACGGEASSSPAGTGGMGSSTGTSTTGGTGGVGGTGGAGGAGGAGGVMMLCIPGAAQACYSGPAATRGIGLCMDGASVCAEDGQSWGACTGQVLPQAETCESAGDDDCNGQTNEGGSGCTCVPGSMSPCYSGPPTTLGGLLGRADPQRDDADGHGVQR